ncbi:MAG TPA: hypothetical protein DDX39_06360 [Bacteroidales bacterium]|nr:MAG: hypothetical protein A2W98_00465 [Bacteroidetes bacterium GWF2_33_38]OFY90225.1 MAG: hypothetical protein A2236_02775 [Bacteroidetes bacterium RIFOXYA2_FULL_33_7]HBF88248.1 hypothetical protein [Bacteroidales bacterium]
MIFGLQVNKLEAQNSQYSHELDSILGIDYLFKESINPIDVQYKEFITKANALYKEQKFAESVVYFRKALKIKPQERLPQYKIEDIYTLFLVNDVVKTKEEANRLVSEIEMSLDNIGNEEVFIQESNKIEPIADVVNKETQPISETLVTEVKKEPVLVHPSIGVEQKPITEVEKIEVSEVQTKEIKANENLETRVIKPEEVKVVESKPITKVEAPTINPVIVEDENRKLQVQYPNEKTVEVTEDVNKKVITIIINRGGEVVIYTKVKHSWGGIFFFAKYPGLPKKNISEQHFVKSTQD